MWPTFTEKYDYTARRHDWVFAPTYPYTVKGVGLISRTSEYSVSEKHFEK